MTRIPRSLEDLETLLSRSPIDPIDGLAWGRIGIGVFAFTLPRTFLKTIGLDPAANPQAVYLTRLAGSRDTALGVLTLASDGEVRRRLVALGVAVDGADTVAGVLGGLSGALPVKAAVIVTAPALAAVAVGLAELDD